jgi:dipeptidase D
LEKENIQLISIDGGGLRNAIPREAVAIHFVRNAQEFILEVTDLKKEILEEFATVEPEFKLILKIYIF